MDVGEALNVRKLDFTSNGKEFTEPEPSSPGTAGNASRFDTFAAP